MKAHGVADVLVIAFMFILLVIGAAIMHAFSLRPLEAASGRQLELKSEHLYKTLEIAQVRPYSLSFLEACAQILVLEEPVVSENYLRLRMVEALEYLRPPDYGVRVLVSYENKALEFFSPHPPGAGERFVQRGKISALGAGGENFVASVELILFKLD